MPVSFGLQMLVLPAAVASAQATLLAGRSCGQQRGSRSVQNGRGGQPSRSGDDAVSVIERSRRCETHRTAQAGWPAVSRQRGGSKNGRFSPASCRYL